MHLNDFLKKIENFSPDSRLWIYQADRTLADNEAAIAEEIIQDFASRWQAHGHPLNAYAAMLFNTFAVLIVDENVEKASGCSIDTSVKIIKELGSQLKVDFFNRFAIAYIAGDMFDCVSKEEFQTLIDTGKSDLLVFNNTITRLSQFENEWIVPFEGSWQSGFFTTDNSFKLSL
jgi:hypothetical protein